LYVIRASRGKIGCSDTVPGWPTRSIVIEFTRDADFNPNLRSGIGVHLCCVLVNDAIVTSHIRLSCSVIRKGV
jgi:hypothetical protein